MPTPTQTPTKRRPAPPAPRATGVRAIPRRSPWRRRLDTPGWGLLPLRAFLGGTFTYAGLQKLADRNFFSAGHPSSIQDQLHAYARQSPIGGLLGSASHIAVPLGLAIALGELAIGLGTLLGLWSRIAAVGGALLSFGFLLVVSWHSRPYYFGADIVFLFAWVPLALVGDGGVLSLSANLRERARKELGAPASGAVSIEFTAVRSLCGSYEKGTCRLRHGQPCEPEPCPVLRAGPPPATPVIENVDRRAFLSTARAAAFVAAGAGGLGVLVGAVGRLAPRSDSRALTTTGKGVRTLGDGKPKGTAPSTTAGSNGAGASGSGATSPTSAAPDPAGGPVTAPGTAGAGPVPTTASQTTVAVRPRGTAIGAAADVPAGGAATFRDPATGDPAYVLHGANGYRAFSAVCTHAGCTVQYSGSEFACPCHGARFSAVDGTATQGPARDPLATISVTAGADGQLYVDG